MFKQFLITRFNLRNSFYSVDKNNTPILTDEWQKHRMNIFRKYCFPSIKNQTNQNFIWLVYFDDLSPDFVMHAIEELKSEYSNFHPKFSSEMELVKTAVLNDIRELINPETRYIITTDLDNDDALHKDFIAEIQGAFIPEDFYVMAPVDGYCLKIESKNIISQYSFVYSPFITLIESVTNFKTVMVRNHRKWADVKTIRLENQPLWMQIIHKKNIVNEIAVNKYISDKKIIIDFSISPDKLDFGLLYEIEVLLLNTKIQLKKLFVLLGARKIKNQFKEIFK